MKIDLHIHSNRSDGRFTPTQIIEEANHRNIKLMSITDHDTIMSQPDAIEHAKKFNIKYITGVELTSYCAIPEYANGKKVQLHLLAYGFNHKDEKLGNLLKGFVDTRKTRAKEVFFKLNKMLRNEGKQTYPDSAFDEIYQNIPLVASRVHIADFLVRKGVVRNRKEAFNKYLIQCNVTLESFSPEFLADYVHNAGGKIIIAHPGDKGGCSMAEFTKDVREQHKIIKKHFIEFIDGLECYHNRHDNKTVREYRSFCEKNNLLISGGSDCHQHPKIQMGTMRSPDFVAERFADLIIS